MRLFDGVAWLLSAILVTVFLTLPTGFSAQIGFATVTLSLLLVVGQIGPKPLLRQLVTVIAMALTVK